MDSSFVIASIIAVLQPMVELVAYLNDVQQATSGQRILRDEAAVLLSLLTSLRNRVEEATRTNDQWFNQMKRLSVEGGSLQNFESMLGKMVDKTTAPNTSSTKDQVKPPLVWKLTESEVEGSSQRIKRLISIVHVALNDDAIDLCQAIDDDFFDREFWPQKVQLGIQQQQPILADSRYIGDEVLAGRPSTGPDDLRWQISDWLQVPDPSTNYRAALKERLPKTNSWLVESPEFHDWKTGEHPFLLLCGRSGCGKTVLSATILEALLQEVASQPDIVIAHFYFDFSNIGKQTLQSTIRTLLFQYALQLPDGLQSLGRLHLKCNRGSRQPTDQQTWTLLVSLLRQAKQVYIVLDALDESRDRDKLFAFFEELMALMYRKIRILATSRVGGDLDISLRPLAHHRIEIETSVVNQDIGTYIRGRLQTDRKLRKWPSSVKEEIAEEFEKKASGVFPWASCQLELLKRCIQLRNVRTALRIMPETLEETYAQIIRGIESSGHLQLAITVLQWLCFANRPLTLSELGDILAIEDREGNKGGFDPAERLPEPSDILAICSGLLHFDTDNSFDDDCATRVHDISDDRIPRPAHQVQVRLSNLSVKEYLLSDRCMLHSSFQSKSCHSSISKGCINYLQYLSRVSFVRLSDIAVTYPLAQYAAQNWWRHGQAELIYSTITDQDVLSVWIRLNRFDGLRSSEVLLPLYYAVTIGESPHSLEVVQRMIEQGMDVNELGGPYQQTALHAAAVFGHEDMTKLLIDAGANIHLKSGNSATALHDASFHGHKEIVKLLLDAGAEVNTKGGPYDTALQAAAVSGCEEVVKLLIDAGADVDVRTKHHQSPLQIASRNRHKEVVEVLLNAGADVDAVGNWGMTALKDASVGGSGEIVKLLLDASAKVDAQGPQSGTALQIASSSGHEEVVSLLIKAGANVNAQGGSAGTAPLAGAAHHGYENIVRRLILEGADVNAQGGQYGNALTAAAYANHVSVAKLLINAGADVNAHGRGYRTALAAALTNGHMELAQVLRDAGARESVGSPETQEHTSVPPPVTSRTVVTRLEDGRQRVSESFS